MAAASGRQEAGLFLVSHGAQPNHTNKHGEMPLHVTARQGLARLVSELLNKYVPTNFHFRCVPSSVTFSASFHTGGQVPANSVNAGALRWTSIPSNG